MTSLDLGLPPEWNPVCRREACRDPHCRSSTIADRDVVIVRKFVIYK
jgi:hypothetical protein